jgi:hypothetical protein
MAAPQQTANSENDFTSGIVVTLVADEIFGSVLTLEACAAILRQFHLNTVIERIVLLMHINARIFMDTEISDIDRRNHFIAFVKFMLDSKHAESVAKVAVEGGKQFRPMSDQALLATLELALAVSPRSGGHSFDSDADRMSFTHVILSFQTDLFSPELREKIKSVNGFHDLTEQDFAEFVRNNAACNTNTYYRNAMGRLYGFCCVAEIGNVVNERMGMSLDAWFEKHFGLSARAYFSLAFLLSGPAQRLNLAQPNSGDLFIQPERFFGTICEPQRSQLLSLVRLSTQRSNEFEAVKNLSSSLAEYVYSANRFFVRPIIDIGTASACVSPTLLMNKFLTGLPYLATEARKQALGCVGGALPESDAKSARAPFGYLFERYVIWLMRQWFANWSRTEVISPYYSSPDKQKASERDLVIVRRDAAFAFEIKASVASLELRQKGSFEQIDRMVKTGALQVHQAAKALLSGQAVRANGEPISGIRRVIPCVVTYDRIPLFPPISDFYEKHLEREAKENLFQQHDGIYPLQFVDVDFLESWETCFDLSPESGSPFGYLEMRARDPKLRFRDVNRNHVVGSPRPESPRPFENLVEKSFDLLDTEIRSWLLPEARRS